VVAPASSTATFHHLYGGQQALLSVAPGTPLGRVSETVGTSHTAILPKWQRRAAWLVEKRLVGFQRVDGLSRYVRRSTIFLAPPQRMADLPAIAPISD